MGNNSCKLNQCYTVTPKDSNSRLIPYQDPNIWTSTIGGGENGKFLLIEMTEQQLILYPKILESIMNFQLTN